MTTTSQADFVDMDKMIRYINREIDYFWSAYESDNANKKFSVHKVPQHMLEVDRNAYEPIILSIGPYHYGSQNLITMEKEKWKSLDYILKLNCKVSLQDYVRSISKLAKQARSCYPEDISMDKKTFLQMLLLDSCFILVKVDGTVLTARAVQNVSAADNNQITVNNNVEEIGVYFTGTVESQRIEHGHAAESLVHEIELTNTHGKQTETGGNIQHCDDTVQHPYGNNIVGDWYANSAWHDIFLLENQIPFFVTETVYELAVSNGLTQAVVREKIVECVEDILRQFPNGIQEFNRPNKFHHLLHLCHMYFRPTDQLLKSQESDENSRYFHRLVHAADSYFSFGSKLEEDEQNLLPIQQKDCFRAAQLPLRWRRASQYHEAGIGLARRVYSERNRHSLLDIKFSRGVIEIPCLAVDENTESLFKNLIAFEQTDPGLGNDFTAYISVMSQLISTSDDATLLAQKGIIVHMLDNDAEVSELFTRLTKQMTFYADKHYYLKSLGHILETHYQSRLNRWIALLWTNHFSNPWLVLAVLATVVMLVCTVVQTVYTVLAYTEPSG
jgi:hypothetical protein